MGGRYIRPYLKLGGEVMNHVTTLFNSNEFGELRTIIIEDEVYFVAKSVATALGYKDTADAIRKHIDEEDKLRWQIADTGQKRETYLINESGLYSLILKSKMPSTKKFKRWVTSEVLPQIRKTVAMGYIFQRHYQKHCDYTQMK